MIMKKKSPKSFTPLITKTNYKELYLVFFSLHSYIFL